MMSYLKAKIRCKVEKLKQSFFLQMSQDQQLKGDSQLAAGYSDDSL